MNDMRSFMEKVTREVSQKIAERRDELARLGCNRCGAPIYEVVEGKPRALPGATMIDHGMTIKVTVMLVLEFTDNVEFLCRECAEKMGQNSGRSSSGTSSGQQSR